MEFGISGTVFGLMSPHDSSNETSRATRRAA